MSELWALSCWNRNGSSTNCWNVDGAVHILLAIFCMLNCHCQIKLRNTQSWVQYTENSINSCQINTFFFLLIFPIFYFVLIFQSKELKFRSQEEGKLLKDLDETDHQPAADVPPQLAGSYLQENLHILQHREPGQESLLRDRLSRTQHQSARSAYSSATTLICLFFQLAQP